MRATRLLVPILALTTLTLAACSPAPLYKAAPGATQATPAVVSQTPGDYATAHVVWGGKIIQVTPQAKHTEIELLAYPLDRSQRPQSGKPAQGRFIAIVPGYLEPLNYPPGSLVTVSGSLHGTRAGTVGAAPYVFPLVDVTDYHRWTAQELRSPWSNVHVGVGVGVGL